MSPLLHLTLHLDDTNPNETWPQLAEDLRAHGGIQRTRERC